MNGQQTTRIFRYGYLFIGAIYVLIAGSILGRGVESSMAPFGVPESIVKSPYYVDAITWVYVHMLVLGIVIGTVGWFAESLRFQRAFTAIMFFVHLVYLYLDLRTSDTELGSGLYRGPESTLPAIVVLVVLLVFGRVGWANFQSADC